MHKKSLLFLVFSFAFVALQATVFEWGPEDGFPVFYLHGFGESHYAGEGIFGSFFDNGNYCLGSFDYPEVIDSSMANIAQEKDTEQAWNALQSWDKKSSNETGVLALGYSRGAASLINLLASRKAAPVCGGIFIASFATLEGPIRLVVERVLGTAFCSSFMAKIAHHTVAPYLFPEYNPKGMQPINMVDQISEDIPLLFIHSVKDDVCPFGDFLKLCSVLKQSGRKNFYAVAVQDSLHCTYLLDPATLLLIKQAIHTFCKKHGFVYDEDFAQDDYFLEQFQPVYEQERTSSLC